MKVSRRGFVQAGIASGVVAAAGLDVIGCGNQIAPAPRLRESLPLRAGKLHVQLKVIDAQGRLVDHYPDLASVGGAITVPIAPAAAGVPEAIVLVHVANEGAAPAPQIAYAAFNAACPHAGCPLGYSPTDALLECPCHGSQFAVDATGGRCARAMVTRPPAPVAPTAYPVALAPDGESLTVDFTVTTLVAFADHPELMSPGGVAVVSGSGGCVPGIVVVRQDATRAVALSAVCTHMQCVVGYAAASRELECPCHGSRFDLAGSVLRGPATQPLAKLTASVGADGIHVTA